MHNLVPKGQKCPNTQPKTSMCAQTSPKGLYLIYIICIYITIIIISHAYAPKRQKRPNTQPKAFICVQTGPKGFSSHLYHSIWRERYCTMMLKIISILIFIYILIILYIIHLFSLSHLNPLFSSLRYYHILFKSIWKTINQIF